MRFAVRPAFCCGCICLGAEDANRMRRVFAIVRGAVANARGQKVAVSGFTAGATAVTDTLGRGFQSMRQSLSRLWGRN